ncbi:outer membrane protein [Haemophilus haemolyticus]|uniref:Porin family protein n=1 Tax=Haemophilus haemolyticus TaxID=726 RepID=A0A852PNZ3_HAEHA|nr:porin family protein [Haemophilus haemolyticus]NYA26808.1 porin family protein [Haemophilus haemolyticus]
MKKIFAIASIAILVPSLSNANFTGWYIGGELGSSQHQISIPYEKLHSGTQYSGNFESQGNKSTGLSILGGFGFQFGQSNFIGQAEAKYRFISGAKSKFEGENITKEKANISIAYLQGYRISERFLPYVKLSLDAGVFDINQENIPKANYVSIENSSVIGIGLGAGIKYAVTDAINVGIEYHRAALNGQDDIKVKTSNIGLNFSYQF